MAYTLLIVKLSEWELLKFRIARALINWHNRQVMRAAFPGLVGRLSLNHKTGN